MDITKLIGLKEEILIESPNKPSTLTTIFDYDSAHLNVRKAAMAPESPIQCVSFRNFVALKTFLN